MSGGGTLVIDPDTGCYTYSTGSDFESLKEGETVEVCFKYWACDPAGGSDEAEVCIEIEGSNDPPIAEDNSYAATKEDLDGPLSGSITGDILDNDSDPDSDNLTIVEITDPSKPGEPVSSFGDVIELSKGSLTLNPEDGAMVYTPNPALVEALGGNETFVELFPYKISDGLGGTSEATVTITVFGENDPPIAENDSETVPEGGEVTDCVL